MLTLDDIRHARERIAASLSPTPTLPEPMLSTALSQRVLLKCELFQRTGSFKSRGGLHWVSTASDAELRCGLGAVSAGNHALGLAWAAQAAGVDVTIVMPEGASEFKVQGSRELGAEVFLQGDINEAWSLMYRLVEERGLTLVHPYDDLRIIAGQGSVGLEIIEQAPDAAAIVCPVGGGGLISGIGVAVRALRPDIRIIGVEPEGAASMQSAWAHCGPHRLDSVDTCAKSLGAAIVGKHTYELCHRHVDALVTVSEAGIVQATRHLLTQTKLFVEPGAAVGVAALLENRLPSPLSEGDIVVIITGGNIGLDELAMLASPQA